MDTLDIQYVYRIILYTLRNERYERKEQHLTRKRNEYGEMVIIKVLFIFLRVPKLRRKKKSDINSYQMFLNENKYFYATRYTTTMHLFVLVLALCNTHA